MRLMDILWGIAIAGVIAIVVYFGVKGSNENVCIRYVDHEGQEYVMKKKIGNYCATGHGPMICYNNNKTISVIEFEEMECKG